MASDEVKHDYHLVDPSPWPIVGSVAAFMCAVGAIAYFQTLKGAPALFGVFSGPWLLLGGAALLIYTFVAWWRDVINESVVRGDHTPVVKLGLDAWPNPFAATLIGYVMSASMILLVGFSREGAAVLPFRNLGWTWFIPVGLLNGAGVLAMYAALARGPVAVVAPLVACYPLATIAFSRLLLGSGGLTLSVGIGATITVAGVAVLLRA